MKEAKGELIHLYWDGKPDGYYVKGHVTEAEALEAVDRYYGDDVDCSGATLGHIWAKWVKVGPDHEECIDGCDFIFRTRREHRAGYFPVTELTPNP